MKTIELSGGLLAIVDDQDFERVSKYHWCADRQRHTTYALGFDHIDGKRKRIMMHRFIIGPPAGTKVDHLDGNGLNNIRDNLRLASNSQNCWNSVKPRSGVTSKYKGVSRSRGGYQVAIKFKGTKYHLGRFRNEDEAGLAYNIKAKELFGEFAKLNDLPGGMGNG